MANIYWLKLKKDFFNTRNVKRLRRKFGADAVIIYEKLLLKSLETDGEIVYQETDGSFFDDLAFDIDEDEEQTSDVIKFLAASELAIVEDNSITFDMAGMIGKETEQAARTREWRRRLEEKRKKLLQGDNEPSQCDEIQSQWNDNRSDQTREKSNQIRSDESDDSDQIGFDSLNLDKQQGSVPAGTTFPPTFEEVQAFHDEVPDTPISSEYFYNYNSEHNWMIGGEKIRDWKKAYIGMEKKHGFDREKAIQAAQKKESRS